MMERLVGVVADGGTSGGSGSTVDEEEQGESNVSMSSVEVSSYQDGTELDLGLGLGLGSGGHVGCGGAGKQQQQVPRILTAKYLPSKFPRSLATVSSPPPSSSSSSSSGGVNHNVDRTSANINVSVGTKRTADFVSSSPPGAGQVVGWPPIRSYRVNSLANQAKSVASGELNATADKSKDTEIAYGARDKNEVHHMQRGHLKGSSFVKVTMDGIGIGRKVDLNAHSCYESMALTLEDMFTIPSRVRDTLKSNGEASTIAVTGMRVPKLLDGTFDYVLTYEDKDGDWMLVGDVPWGMFLSSVKRLRIMKTPEAKGLSPRDEGNGTQRIRPI